MDISMKSLEFHPSIVAIGSAQGWSSWEWTPSEDLEMGFPDSFKVWRRRVVEVHDGDFMEDVMGYPAW